MNPWLDRTNINWAHQGGAREAPSNTVYAMDVATKFTPALEFDVHATSDGEIVLMHDQTLDRTTDAANAGHPPGTRIRNCTLKALQKLDAAYWWVEGQVDDHEAPEEAYTLRDRAATDPRLRVPTLDEVLGKFDGPYTIEIKDQRAVKGTIALLREHGVEPDQVIVTSFRKRTVWHLRWQIFRTRAGFGVAPDGWTTMLFFLRSRRGWRPRHFPYVAIQPPPDFAFSRLPAPFSWIGRLLPERWRSFTVVDLRFLDLATDAGVAVHVWTINRRRDMDQLLRLGVHGIMTDCPEVLSEVLAARFGG